jgi:serine phosphatase RsbU (regulator of sigma subunit)
MHGSHTVEPTNVLPPLVPLHRLLRQHEAMALLAEFEDLLPGGNLALLDADSHVYAGYVEWTRAELQSLYTRIKDDQIIYVQNVVLQPLIVNSHFLGALIARTGERRNQKLLAENVLRSLHHCLMLLLEHSLDTRDVVSEALSRYREINLLYRIGETIGSCLEAEKIPRLALEEVHHIVEADVGIVILSASPVSNSKPNLWEVSATFGPDQDVQVLHRAYYEAIDGSYETGQPSILDQDHILPPIKTSEQTLGVLLLGRLGGNPEFTAGDLKLVLTVAHQAAISIQTAHFHKEEIAQQRLNEELAIGQKMQQSLLPERCPVVPGWDFAAIYRSARHVGGDLYDFIQLPGDPNHLGMMIADVTGKGIPAALFMASSRTIIRTESMNGHSPGEILRRANHLIVEDIRYRLFLSAFYASLDIQNGHLVYANAGHDWPLLFRADSHQIHWLNSHGFVLGAFQDSQLEEQTVDIAPNDILVFYTDGVTQARNANDELFGEERLSAAVKTNAAHSAQLILEAIVTSIEKFQGDTPQSDDLTLFVVKRQS